MLRRLIAILLFVAGAAVSVPAAGQPLKATVTIESAKILGPVNPLVFGGFIEHFHRQIYGGIFEPGSPLADEKGFRKDVIAALRQMRVSVVRWPGGCFVSAYHWKDGVGPNRQPSFDKAWCVEEPNTFGTDEFVEWCRRIGAEPYICGNAGTGTPEEMSDWVEYCNQDKGRWARLRAANGFPKPHGVRYWSVGNENWGGHEIGAKTADEWALFVLETAKMMRRADRSAILTAAALADENWTGKLLRTAGHSLNLVSIHAYWDHLWGRDAPSGYAECMMRTGQPEAMIAATERIIAKTGHKGRIGIAFDEWNLRGWHHPGLPLFSPEDIRARDRNDINATYTMADAVFSACFLNTCLRHADTVKMANIAPIVNARGPIYAHPKGIVKRTTFHVLAMYANLLGEKVARAEVAGIAYQHGRQSVPAVDVVATCDDAKKRWRIALVNRHAAQPVQCSVVLDGKPLAGKFRATVLAGDSTDAYNDVDRPERVVPQKTELSFTDGAAPLPPHSVSIVEVE